MPERPHHQRIARLLGSLDAARLFAHKCLFGGGTVIAMLHGEYRESRDVDFLVSDLEAYRSLRGIVTREGIAGLFVFVFIPFWMTGPVVGAIIGFLIGLGSAVNLAIVLSASALGVVVYATFLEHLNAWATAVHPYAVFGTVLALVVLAALLRQRRRGAALPSARAPDEPDEPGA